MKRFIDDIAIEVIEAKLISPLGDVFSPVAVSAMPADLVTRIAGESEENHAQREQLTKQLDVLVKGSDTCKRFIGVRLLGKKAPSVSLYQLLLMYWIDADDCTIQLDPKSNSANKNSSNFDVAPDDSLQEDVRSLSDRALSWRSSPIEVSEPVSTEVRERREETPTPESDIMEAPQEGIYYPLNSSKKKSKKSKISANRAIFEEE